MIVRNTSLHQESVYDNLQSLVEGRQRVREGWWQSVCRRTFFKVSFRNQSVSNSEELQFMSKEQKDR